jgi:hypothetical protein
MRGFVHTIHIATEETFKANMSVLQKLAQSVLSDTEPDVGYVTATRVGSFGI